MIVHLSLEATTRLKRRPVLLVAQLCYNRHSTSTPSCFNFVSMGPPLAANPSSSEHPQHTYPSTEHMVRHHTKRRKGDTYAKYQKVSQAVVQLVQLLPHAVLFLGLGPSEIIVICDVERIRHAAKHAAQSQTRSGLVKHLSSKYRLVDTYSNSLWPKKHAGSRITGAPV